MICRYFSPRGSFSVLPSVWGNAGRLWRPWLSAQSLHLFLYLVPNPAAHHVPSSILSADTRVLSSPALGSAQPHALGPAQPFSPHALLASSPSAPQCPILFSAHTFRHTVIISIRPSVPPRPPPAEGAVIPPHVYLCVFCLRCCFRTPIFILSVLVRFLSSIHSALLPSTAAPAAGQQLWWQRGHVEDSKYA